MRIKDILKNITKEERTIISQRLSVRELDEESAGLFVGYVDDKNTSYDVSLKFSNDDLVASSCDCDAGSFMCIHRLAAFLNLNEGEKLKSKPAVVAVRKKKKVDPLLEFISGIPTDKLHEWLYVYLTKNKDALIDMQLSFQSDNKEIHPSAVKPIVDEVIKTILKTKRRNVPAADMKKVTDLLKKAIQPILEFLDYNIHTVQGLAVFSALSQAIEGYRWTIESNSNQLENLCNQISDRVAETVSSLRDNEEFTLVGRTLWKRYLKQDRLLTGMEMNCMIQISHMSEAERKISLGKIVLDLLLKDETWVSDKVEPQIASNALTILANCGLLEKVYKRFTPRKLEYKYNMILVKQVQMFDSNLALEFLLEIINPKYPNDYNLHFLKILKSIYEEKGHIVEALNISKTLFLIEPSLEYYLELVDQIKDDIELRVFKNKVRSSLSSTDILIQILGHEKNWIKLLKSIGYNTSLNVIWPFVDELYQFDKMTLLDRILVCAQYYKIKEDEIPGLRKMILEFIKQGYNKEEFNKAYGEHYSFYSGFRVVIRDYFFS